MRASKPGVEDGSLVTPFADPAPQQRSLPSDRIEPLHCPACAALWPRHRDKRNREQPRLLEATRRGSALCARRHDDSGPDAFEYAPRTLEVLAAGTQTTIQDYPGRLKFWNVGVPPSGPMDALSFRLANQALDSPANVAALEITVSGPTLEFNVDATILPHRRAMPPTSTADRYHTGRSTVRRGETLRMGTLKVRATAPLSGGARRFDDAALLGQPFDLHVGKVRRPRRPCVDGGRCLAFGFSGRRLDGRVLGPRAVHPM